MVNSENIAKEIEKSFPAFKQNLCKIILTRKEVFIDSGLAESVMRAMDTIKKKYSSVIHKNLSELKYQNGSLQESPFQYVYSFLEYMYEARIAWAENFCKDVKENDSGDIKCQKIFEAFIRLMNESGNREIMVDICNTYSNLDEWLKDIEVRETELKDILDCYSYFSSKPLNEDWQEIVKQLSKIITLFKEQFKEDTTFQAFWNDIDKIINTFQNSDNLENALNSLLSKSFYKLTQLPSAIRAMQSDSKMAMEIIRQSFSTAKQRSDDIGQIWSILWKYYRPKRDEIVFLNAILEIAVFRNLPKIQHLSAIKPYIKPFLEYFIDLLKLGLELIGHQSAFGRTAYALRKNEIIEIIADKLEIEKDDKFLDMFSNIPAVSYCASLLGAEVYSVDCDFVETDRFTNSLRKVYSKQREFIQDLLYTSGDSKKALEKLSKTSWEELLDQFKMESYIGGPFAKDRVYPNALIQVIAAYSPFFAGIFDEIIKYESLRFISHKFSIENEVFKKEDRINVLKNDYFTKMLIDPPYGKETAEEGFVPEQGLIVAKKGLKEAFRVLNHGGRAVLTLPSYKKPNWDQFIEMQWREKVLSFAKNIGLSQIAENLPEGRALALLQKQ